MKKENTAARLNQLMNQRNLRQIDILNLTKPYCDMYSVKMNKSDISQYVSGKVEPNQDKLAVLSMALRVNPAWLMGYDVEMTEGQSAALSSENISDTASDLCKEHLINNYNLMNEESRARLAAYSDDLIANPANRIESK